jgi:hypothetical protein
LNKVEFKKNFDIGYEEIVFSANHDETLIRIKNNYSVPSSMVTSSISQIEGTLFEEKRGGFIFSELVEIESGMNEEVHIELGRFVVDEENFDEGAFIKHLINQVTNKILYSDYFTVLKKLTVH